MQKFFCWAVEHRLSDQSEIQALELKKEFRRSANSTG